jgi:hypothetical protein
MFIQATQSLWTGVFVVVKIQHSPALPCIIPGLNATQCVVLPSGAILGECNTIESLISHCCSWARPP